MLPYFGDSVAGHLSREIQPRARVLILATCSRVKGPVVRGTQRFSRLNSRLPRGQTFQSRKTLRKFFMILSLSVLAARPGDLLATHFSREKCVFCISKTVFKTFSVFPLNFCDYSLSSPFLSQLKLTQTLLKLHFGIFSSRIFKKRYGFSLFHFIFHVLSLLFLFL